MSVPDTYSDDEVALEKRVRVKLPRLYKVLLHNDDFTSMEFVVLVLVEIFHKNIEEATAIMLNVHNKGTGVAGIYTREICECKIDEVHDLAEENEFPLLCTMEPA